MVSLGVYAVDYYSGNIPYNISPTVIHIPSVGGTATVTFTEYEFASIYDITWFIKDYSDDTNASSSKLDVSYSNDWGLHGGVYTTVHTFTLKGKEEGEVDFQIRFTDESNSVYVHLEVRIGNIATPTPTPTPTPTSVAIANVTINMPATNYVYDGTAKTPKPSISNGGVTLTENTHYTLTYTNNTNAGTATLTITMKNGYSGSTQKTFNIAKANPTIQIQDKSEQYTGSAISVEPATAVGVIGGNTPTGSFAYTYYTNQACTTQTTNANSGAAGNGQAPVNVGVYYVKAVYTSTNTNYNGGSATAIISITQEIIDINNLTIIISPQTYTYNGMEKRPNVIIKSQPESPVRVTLNPNGGTVSPTYVDVYYSGMYGALPTATKTGYNQNGWWTTQNGGEQITENTRVSNNEAHTIFAHWIGKSFTVTFDANGGTCTTSEKSVTYDQTYGDLPVPTWTGHTFNGWYTARTGGTRRTSSSIVNLSENEVLYAHWTTTTTCQGTGCTGTVRSVGCPTCHGAGQVRSYCGTFSPRGTDYGPYSIGCQNPSCTNPSMVNWGFQYKCNNCSRIMEAYYCNVCDTGKAIIHENGWDGTRMTYAITTSEQAPNAQNISELRYHGDYVQCGTCSGTGSIYQCNSCNNIFTSAVGSHCVHGYTNAH